MASSPLPDRERLLTAQALTIVALSILSGAAFVFQAGHGLAKFGGYGYIPRVTTLGIVRESAPAISTSAMFVALVAWSHALSPSAVRSSLSKALAQAALVAIPSLAVATAVAIATSFAVVRFGYNVHWSAIRAGIGVLNSRDFLVQAQVFAFDVALVGAVCWFVIPGLTRLRWPLPVKIMTGWLGLAVLNATLGLVVDLLAA